MKYSPQVYSDKYKRNVPLVDVYLDLMETLNKDNNDLRKDYKAKLLGNSPIVDASAYYWDTTLFLSLEGAIDYHSWSSIPIHEKAKLRAIIQLRNMADIVERHRKEMDEERKKVFSAKPNKVGA